MKHSLTRFRFKQVLTSAAAAPPLRDERVPTPSLCAYCAVDEASKVGTAPNILEPIGNQLTICQDHGPELLEYLVFRVCCAGQSIQQA